MKKSIAQVVVGLPLEGHFDYSLDPTQAKTIDVGQRVRVSFGQGSRIGYAVGFSERSKFGRLKPITTVLDSTPCLNKDQLKLAKKFSEYYGCSLGEAIEAILPTNLRNRKTSINLTKQAEEYAKLKRKPQHELLHDQTKSSRWEHINERIDNCLMSDRDVLFLIPENALIDEVTTQLKDYFDTDIAVFDKSLSAKKELKLWMDVYSGKRRIVVGTRSSVFAPIVNLGLIVIYDEENSSYKQEQTPHYHVRDVAFMRSEVQRCDLLFVSSAPSAELWKEAKAKRIKKITIEGKAQGTTQLIDMSNYKQRMSLVSFPLRSLIEQTVEKREKVLLYLNRKGFATRTSCNNCNFIVKCDRCDTNMMYSYTKRKLICRLCQSTKTLPKVCPECGSSYIRSTGTGVEKLESDLSLIFPHARIGHFDADSLSIPKDADIIIATQAIHKIIALLSFDLVAILRFDSELNRQDFRSMQRAFSTFMQLKQFAKKKFVIQTNNMDNYCVQAILKDDYEYFYREELKFRQEIGFPPYKHLLAVGMRGKDEEKVLATVNDLYTALEKKCDKTIEIMDPHPDVLPKLRDKYRFTILLKGRSVKKMIGLVKNTLKSFKRHGLTVVLNIDG